MWFALHAIIQSPQFINTKFELPSNFQLHLSSNAEKISEYHSWTIRRYSLQEIPPLNHQCFLCHHQSTCNSSASTLEAFPPSHKAHARQCPRRHSTAYLPPALSPSFSLSTELSKEDVSAGSKSNWTHCSRSSTQHQGPSHNALPSNPWKSFQFVGSARYYILLGFLQKQNKITSLIYYMRWTALELQPRLQIQSAKVQQYVLGKSY